jgi:murein DD-endopeptidase MepM/ murein hydrolase activator NlpD
MVTAHRIPVSALVPVVLSVLCGLALAGSAAALDEPESDPVGVWPLQPTPEVVAGFDPPDSPYGSGHRGVDLAGSVGQVVHTALAGTITYAGSLAGRGVVVVDHGTTRTTYEPVSTSVPLGATVARGDPIGTLQLGGSHCFPRACLHWGWIEGETYLDPLRLVGSGPVRLLPLWRDEPVPLTTAGARSAYAGWVPLLTLLRMLPGPLALALPAP